MKILGKTLAIARTLTFLIVIPSIAIIVSVYKADRRLTGLFFHDWDMGLKFLLQCKNAGSSNTFSSKPSPPPY